MPAELADWVFSPQVELSGSVLTDLIREELSRDESPDATLSENEAELRATQLQQAPSLEMVMTRLQQMEVGRFQNYCTRGVAGN